jgi:hypothetical protein
VDCRAERRAAEHLSSISRRALPTVRGRTSIRKSSSTASASTVTGIRRRSERMWLSSVQPKSSALKLPRSVVRRHRRNAATAPVGET